MEKPAPSGANVTQGAACSICCAGTLIKRVIRTSREKLNLRISESRKTKHAVTRRSAILSMDHNLSRPYDLFTFRYHFSLDRLFPCRIAQPVKIQRMAHRASSECIPKSTTHNSQNTRQTMLPTRPEPHRLRRTAIPTIARWSRHSVACRPRLPVPHPQR